MVFSQKMRLSRLQCVGAMSRIRPSADLTAADWIAPRLGAYGEWRIDSLVPSEFEAYARIFHPVEGSWDKRLRWAEVAAWSGRIMHPHAEFELLERRLAGEGRGRTHGDEPMTGVLMPDLVVELSEVLGRHTESAQRCWFCIWDGGWIRGPGSIFVALGTPAHEQEEIQQEWQAAWEPSFARAALTGPRVRLPQREYILLEGPLDAVGEIGEWTHWQGQSHFEPQSPNLWWTDDRAWCVATEIDLDSTHVGGSAALVHELLSDSRFEALEVHGSDRREDTINRSN